MNKSNINELSAGTSADSSPTAQNEHVSQPNANTNVVGIPFQSREIKFRARRNDINGEFQYFTLNDIADLRGLFSAYEDWRQYTGLKDKNGKEIYEDDIIKLGCRNYKIVFSDYTASFMRETPTGYLRYSLNEYDCGEDFEIIGNVFENPELLQTLR